MPWWGKASVNQRVDCRERMAQRMMADDNYKQHDRIFDEADRLNAQGRVRLERVEVRESPTHESLKESDEAMEESLGEEQDDLMMDYNILMRLGSSEEWEEAFGRLNQ
jgi:hypothetical protein